MTEENVKIWVKDKINQNKVVKQFFADNKPHNHKLAFFMAGIPGAGKTEFTQNTIKEESPELISIEHDQLVEYIDGYRPEDYYKYRKAGSVLVTRIFSECLKHDYGFVFDGTLSHENGARNINKCLKHGYQVIVVYISQASSAAWELTQARELVRNRAIERSGFVETCKKINPNLLSMFKAHKTDPKFSFWLVDKQSAKDASNAVAIIHSASLNRAAEVEEILSKEYTINLNKE